MHTGRPIDWADVKFGVFIGIVTAAIKLIGAAKPEWHVNATDALAAFLLTLGYIIARGRRQPEKLDEWGLTTPITLSAMITGFILLIIGIGILAACGLLLKDTLTFKPSYVPRMIEYIVGAFPQQFFMCSVGLVTLAKLHIFRGIWRLPLTVGIVFCLAHFWTPAHFPGTIIPIQMAITLPAGVATALYFLKFRTILPLTAIHAVFYILLHHWIELHL